MVFTGFFVAALMAAQAPAAAATGRVTGQVVVEGSNTPIADATVVLMPMLRGVPTAPMLPPPRAVTDANGRFAADGLPPGTFHVDVQKAGYAPFSSPADPKPSMTITVAAGQSVENLTLTLRKGGAIAGRVLGAKGEPLANIGVVALSRMPRGRGPVRWIPVGMTNRGSTNDLGDFRLFGLAPGDYIIAASANHNGPFAPATTSRTTLATTYYPGTIDQGSALAVTVSADATVENITISMQTVPAFTVSGVVVDANGAPVSGAMIMMMPAAPAGAFGGAGGSNVRTDESGAFVVSGVAAGTYRMMASAPVVSRSPDGGGTIVSGYTFVAGGTSANIRPPVEVTVTDADLAGGRVVVDRHQ